MTVSDQLQHPVRLPVISLDILSPQDGLPTTNMLLLWQSHAWHTHFSITYAILAKKLSPYNAHTHREKGSKHITWLLGGMLHMFANKVIRWKVIGMCVRGRQRGRAYRPCFHEIYLPALCPFHPDPSSSRALILHRLLVWELHPLSA